MNIAYKNKNKNAFFVLDKTNEKPYYTIELSAKDFAYENDNI